MQIKHLGFGAVISSGVFCALPVHNSVAAPDVPITDRQVSTAVDTRVVTVVPTLTPPEQIPLVGMSAPAAPPATSAPNQPVPLSGVKGTPTNAIAQSPDPNRDRFTQPTTPPAPVPVEPTQPTIPTPEPTTTPEPTAPPVAIPVRKIEVTGSTIFGPAELNPITQPLEGRSVTLEELRTAADAITQLYLNQGYITSRAVLVDQTIADGVVAIRVIEGSIERIDIEGTQRLNQAYIRRRIELGSQPPLSRDKLEDQLRLLKADPLFTNVEASLRPGSQLGQSVLIVRVTEAKALEGFLGIDNYSPPSVGSIRVGGGATYRNLTGIGDTFAASYFHTITGGSDQLDFTYTAPVNPMNGTVQLRVDPNWNHITDNDFEDLDIRGRSQLYELSYRQPLLRNPREEFAVSVGLAVQNGQTFLFNDLGFPFGFGPDADGNSRTRVFKFGQDYVKRDPQGAWALRSQFSLGVDILNATTNQDPVPDGRFFSWLGQIQRVQRLGNDHLLIAQGDIQLTPDSLLPSQQFVIGGGQSLRGFRQNARSGDNGFRISLEDRIALQRNEAGIPTLQLAPFIDFGKVWNQSGNPNPLPRQRFLAGGGLGLIWQPTPRLNVRLDYAVPFLRLDDRGSDPQDKAFYFSVYYQP